MAAVDFLRDWAKTNPQMATIVLATVGVFAAVALIASFGIELEARIPAAAIVIGIGFALWLVTRIICDQILSKVLPWAAFSIFMIWVGFFVASRAAPGAPVPDCIVYFWQDCRAIGDAAGGPPRLTPTSPTSALPAAITVASLGPFPLAAVSPNRTPPNPALGISTPRPPVLLVQAPPAGVVPANYQVFFQFAGVINRDDIRVIMKALQAAGWNVQGLSGGGERTTAAIGFNEVRYGDAADKSAAEAVAAAAWAAGAARLTSRAPSTKLNPSIGKGKLEVWISN